MYKVSFSRELFGVPFLIALVEVRLARSFERALRAAELRFERHHGLADWRLRADTTMVEQLSS
jgi:hypothetical protein